MRCKQFFLSKFSANSERFDQMNYVGQREESLQQIVSIPREESIRIVSGNYYHNAILQNLSEQDTCFDSKDLIDRERNAVDLYDQSDSSDSKGQMSLISFKEGFPKDYLQLARNVLNQLPAKFPANSVAPYNEVWNIGDRIEGSRGPKNRRSSRSSRHVTGSTQKTSI